MSVKFAQSPTEILQWERLVISDRRLSHAVVRVATRLVLFVNSQSGLAWPSLKALMDKSQTSLSTVKRAIRQLKALGWVAVISGNARRTNRYRMVLQPLPSDSLTPSVTPKSETAPPVPTPAPVQAAPVQAPTPPPASPPAPPISHDRAAYLPTPRSCTPEEIVGLIEHFNRTAHTCLPTTPGTDTYRIVRQALQHYPPAILRGVIDLKVHHWMETPQYRYLQPKTLFNPSKLERYVSELYQQRRRDPPPPPPYVPRPPDPPKTEAQKALARESCAEMRRILAAADARDAQRKAQAQAEASLMWRHLRGAATYHTAASR